MEPFIKPFQYNFIRSQVDLLTQQLTTVHDQDVLDAVIYSAAQKIFDLIPVLTAEQEELLMLVRNVKSEADLIRYIEKIKPFVASFPSITESQLQQLFRKTKKLRNPPLHSFDFLKTTYLSWNDTGNKKKFFVYPLQGEWVGVEGHYVPTIKKGICTVCHQYSDVTLVSARTNQSADHYRAVGNYICIDSDHCNEQVTDPTSLEKLLAKMK